MSINSEEVECLAIRLNATIAATRGFRDSEKVAVCNRLTNISIANFFAVGSTHVDGSGVSRKVQQPGQLNRSESSPFWVVIVRVSSAAQHMSAIR